jgi:hypothetical protein
LNLASFCLKPLNGTLNAANTSCVGTLNRVTPRSCHGRGIWDLGREVSSPHHYSCQSRIANNEVGTTSNI